MANGTAIVLNRVIEQLRIASDQYATPTLLQTNFQMASEMLQNTFLGAIQDYQLGRPIPAKFSTATSDIRNLLDPFRAELNWIYDSNTKIYTADVTALEAKGLEVTKTEVWSRNDISFEFPFPQVLSEYLKSQINFPTDEVPYGKYLGKNQIRVYPDHTEGTVVTSNVIFGDPEIQVAFLDSKKTVDPDPAKTTPTLWGKRAYDSLVYLVLQNMSVPFTQPTLYGLAMELNKQSV